MFESPLFLLAFLAIGIALFFVLQLIERNGKKKIASSESLVDDFFYIFILSLKPWVYIIMILLAGSLALELDTLWHEIANGLILILGTYQGVISLTAVGTFTLKHLNGKREKERRVYKAFSKILGIILWAIGILFVLSNFGIDVVALLAALGIGGIAIAFAFQSILKDLFSYMTILLDEPIEEGDVIEVDGREGTVKHIGIKTTRIKAVGGEEIVIPNSTMTGEDIVNFKRAKIRRNKFSIFLDVSITRKKLQTLLDALPGIIESIEGLEHKSTYVSSIGNEGVEIKNIYTVKNRNVTLNRETMTELHMTILEHLQKKKIKMYVNTLEVTQM